MCTRYTYTEALLPGPIERVRAKETEEPCCGHGQELACRARFSLSLAREKSITFLITFSLISLSSEREPSYFSSLLSIHRRIVAARRPFSRSLRPFFWIPFRKSSWSRRSPRSAVRIRPPFHRVPPRSTPFLSALRALDEWWQFCFACTCISWLFGRSRAASFFSFHWISGVQCTGMQLASCICVCSSPPSLFRERYWKVWAYFCKNVCLLPSDLWSDLFRKRIVRRKFQ